jgi:hypothetical protein
MYHKIWRLDSEIPYSANVARHHVASVIESWSRVQTSNTWPLAIVRKEICKRPVSDPRSDKQRVHSQINLLQRTRQNKIRDGCKWSIKRKFSWHILSYCPSGCLEVLRNTVSQRRSPGSCPGQPMLTLVKKVTLGQVFLLLLRISPVIIISTVTLHTYISPEGWTISPMVAAFQRQSHPIGMNKNKLIKCLTLGNQSPWYLPTQIWAVLQCRII